MTHKPGIELKTFRLAIGYGGRPLASDLTLSLRQGLTALIGRNGAGKSTLIKTLTGNLRPLGGEVSVDGRSVGSYSLKERARLMALVTTDSHMAGGLRLHELVALGRIPHTGTSGRLGAADRRIVEEAMERVGVIHKKDRFIAELSDGERQKGLIARALAQDTSIIIMDEPFSFLDVASRLEITSLITRLAMEGEKSVLFSTHEVTEAFQNAPYLWMMTPGGFSEGTPASLIESGAVDRLFDSPLVKFDRTTKTFRLI